MHRYQARAICRAPTLRCLCKTILSWILACIIHEPVAGVIFSLPRFDSKHISASRICFADAMMGKVLQA